MSAEARTGDERYAVQDTISGAIYPQPNKLIAEKVADLHGQCIVLSFTPPADGVREAPAARRALDAWNGLDSKSGLGAALHVGQMLADALTAEVRSRGPITEAKLDAAYAVLRGIAPREWVRKALEAARDAEAES